MVRKEKRSAEVIALWAVFIFLIVVSASESLMKGVSISHLLIIQMFIIYSYLSDEEEERSLSHPG
jgi:hypothetical protein